MHISPFISRLKWILKWMILLLFLMTLYRICFFYSYRADGVPFSGTGMWMGLRFDARVVSILGLSAFILTSFRFLNPFYQNAAKKFWNILLDIVFVIFLVFYVTDYFHYDYLQHRLNASVLGFLEDMAISAEMMWETYPVIRMGLVLVLLLVGWHLLMKRWLNQGEVKEVSKKGRFGFGAIFVCACALCIFGKLGQYPLRWSDAYVHGNTFKANVILNPFQSFFSTMKFRNAGYDAKALAEYYDEIASYLGVQNPSSTPYHFNRTQQYSDTSEQYNVVLVLCESFAAAKSSMFGNELDPTPYFNELTKQGAFFTRCFTPSFGTARGVWALITGIPDVNRPKTASRNPLAVDQHTIINEFKGYEKYYFLGGSTTWANIRGVLMNNIEGLQIFEQDHFSAGKEDVWGISDKNLFIEADAILNKSTKPFFAIIQTANNHRPYTIPDEDLKVFEKAQLGEDVLKKNLFHSNEEYNAFRYMDFSIKTYMEKAKSSPYFSKTIFVFIGDHGLRGGAGDLFPESFTKYDFQAEHVPLLFYAPGLIEPKVIQKVCSQLDVLPSIAHLAKRNHINTTMGMNLFSSDSLPRYAFIADPEKNSIAAIGDTFYWERSATGNEILASVLNNEPLPASPYIDSVKLQMKKWALGFYEASRYLLLNNKKTP